jgi:hypothetical protein
MASAQMAFVMYAEFDSEVVDPYRVRDDLVAILQDIHLTFPHSAKGAVAIQESAQQVIDLVKSWEYI